jgi:hypothetical protein
MSQITIPITTPIVSPTEKKAADRRNKIIPAIIVPKYLQIFESKKHIIGIRIPNTVAINIST